MNRWKLTFEMDVPEGMALTPIVHVMELAAEDVGCEVQGWVERECIRPPLRAVPDNHRGSE